LKYKGSLFNFYFFKFIYNKKNELFEIKYKVEKKRRKSVAEHRAQIEHQLRLAFERKSKKASKSLPNTSSLNIENQKLPKSNSVLTRATSITPTTITSSKKLPALLPREIKPLITEISNASNNQANISPSSKSSTSSTSSDRDRISKKTPEFLRINPRKNLKLSKNSSSSLNKKKITRQLTLKPRPIRPKVAVTSNKSEGSRQNDLKEKNESKETCSADSVGGVELNSMIVDVDVADNKSRENVVEKCQATNENSNDQDENRVEPSEKKDEEMATNTVVIIAAANTESINSKIEDNILDLSLNKK
jgi:hypothetical protein